MTGAGELHGRPGENRKICGIEKTLPVMREGKLAGILRERDIILEIAKIFGILERNQLTEW